MKEFTDYLNKTGEVGFVDLALGPLIYCHGLPHAHPREVVLFESGELGYVISFTDKQVEVALLSPTDVKVGTRVARTDTSLKMQVDDSILGSVITAADMEKTIFCLDSEEPEAGSEKPEIREIDSYQTSFTKHTKVTHPLEVEITMVDMVVPLAKGQRQIVIGDRKTGKSTFLEQVVLAAAQKDLVCIYVAIGKTEQEIQRIVNFFSNNPISKKVIVVASTSSHRPALIFLTPYIGMTIAEHFRDKGKDVLLVLDDLTTHARYYRELMLLAKRFPGRSSYPGDIFYIHSRLLERAGSFAAGTITCLPVAQSVQGDLSGYIQTNLMSITDGHFFFDGDLFDQGRRPAINPFLSVTRVGNQAQTSLEREIGRQLRGFLSHFEKIKQFKHFQSELSESVQSNFDLGERLQVFLDQPFETLIPHNANLLLFAAIWSNFWKNVPVVKMKQDFSALLQAYGKNQEFHQFVDSLIQESATMNEFLQKTKVNQVKILEQTKTTPAPGTTTPPAPTPVSAPTPAPTPESATPGEKS